MHARTSLLVAAVFGLAVLVGGCGGAAVSTTNPGGTNSTAQSTTTTAASTLVFAATLKGSNEVPAVKTSASGTLTLTVEPDGFTVDYVITLKKLSNVTVARLRQGKPGASGTALVTLFNGPTKKGVFTGVLAQGSFTAQDLGGALKGKTVDDLVTMIQKGQVYLNVGTSTHKGGAISGQLAASASTTASTTTTSLATGESQSSGTTQPSGTQGTQSLATLFGQYKQAASVSLDYAVTTSAGTTTTGKLWEQAGKKLKIQTTMNGVENVMIIDLVASTMIVYQPSTKQGMQTKLNLPFQDPAGYANGVDVSDMQDLGTEDVNGQTCRVLQYTTTSSATGGSKITVKMWLSESLGFPVKVTSTSADGKTTTMEYSNIKVGALPSDTFTVPAGVKITTTP